MEKAKRSRCWDTINKGAPDGTSAQLTAEGLHREDDQVQASLEISRSYIFQDKGPSLREERCWSGVVWFAEERRGEKMFEGATEAKYIGRR